jgi:DnaJ-class molecular chaperone
MTVYHDCPECEGVGAWTAYDEETRRYELVTCPMCDGSGAVADKEA